MKLRKFLINGTLVIILFLSLTFSNEELKSQLNNNVTATIDTNAGLIGDHLHLKLNVHFDSLFIVKFPLLSDSLGKLVILKKGAIDTVRKNGYINLNQEITVTSYDSGYYQIPELLFLFSRINDSTLYPVKTSAVNIVFHSVPIDTTKPIKDIKPPLEVPFSIWDYIWYIIGLIILLILSYYGYKYIKNRKLESKLQPKFDPKIPAHIFALLELEKLEKEKLWQSGKVKEYYSRLTDILRLYLERRFDFPALESTTSEILYQINRYISGVEILSNLKYTLEFSDLVKFAKQIPLPDENIKIMEITKDIIQSTVPIVTDSELNAESK
ncbi:MAG: hypothetical protein ACPL1A_00175 [Candidatus Kapaibacteriota bacterium]